MPFTPPPQDVAAAGGGFTPPPQDVAAAQPFVPPVQDQEAAGIEHEGGMWSRLVGSVVEGFRQPFADPDLGLSEDTKNVLRDVGLLRKPSAPPNPIYTINDALLVGIPAAGDLALRTLQAPFSAGANLAGQVVTEATGDRTSGRRLTRDLNQMAAAGAVAGATTMAPRGATGAAALHAVEDPMLTAARARIAAPTLGETTRRSVFSRGQELLTKTLDQLYPVKVLGEAAGDLAPYREARLLAGIRGPMLTLMEKGTFRRKPNGDLELDGGPSLKDVFKPVSGFLDDGLIYFAGRRARELEKRGVETGFEPGEVDAMLGIEKYLPQVRESFEKYQDYNRRVLTFAKDSGLLSQESFDRILAAGPDYVPFYRAFDEGELPALGKGSGQKRAPGYRIKGSERSVRDILDNIIQNSLAWTQVAIQNSARRDVLDMVESLGGEGVAVRMKNPPAFAKLADARTQEILAEAGIDRELHPVFTRKKDLPENVISVMRDGKREFWEVKDPLFFDSMQALAPKRLAPWLRALSFPANVLRYGVTHTPEFMMRNAIRDTQAAFLQSRANFRPLLDSLRGQSSAVTHASDWWEMLLNGGGFSTTFAGEVGTGRNLRDLYGPAGIDKNRVIDTTQKAGRFLERLVTSFEVGTRVGEYRRLRLNGASAREAALGAREISTDFSMRGSSDAVKMAAATIPFLNARVQGLYRMGRAAQERPGTTLTRGAVVTALSMALHSENMDNPNYRALPDWVRDNHFVIYIDGSDSPYLIPKGFEQGYLWSSIPERMLDAISQKDGVRFAKVMGKIAADTFSVDVPQVLSPVLDIAMNRTFQGSPVVPERLKDLPPQEQYQPWTPELLVEAAQALEEHTGVAVSPLQAQHVIEGYLGTMGSYLLEITDAIARGDERPSPRRDEQPILKALTKDSPLKNTQYEADFYELATLARQVAATVQVATKEARKLEDFDERERALFAISKAAERVGETAGKINRATRLVVSDQKLSRDDKRRALDHLFKARNRLFEEFMRGIPTELGVGYEKPPPR